MAFENRTSDVSILIHPDRSLVGIGYAYHIGASDPEGSVLTYQLVQAPSGMVIDPSGRISWTPGAAQMGEHPVTVTVTDAVGAKATQSWTLTISDRDLNRSPVITSVPTASSFLERPYRYDLDAVDPDRDPLLWELLSAPSGAVIDPLTGVLTWQPTPQQLGDQTFVVRVLDARGAYSIQEFTLGITGSNLPPNILSVPPTTGGVGGAYRYQVAASDAEGEALSYRLLRRPQSAVISQQSTVSSQQLTARRLIGYLQHRAVMKWKWKCAMRVVQPQPRNGRLKSAVTHPTFLPPLPPPRPTPLVPASPTPPA